MEVAPLFNIQNSVRLKDLKTYSDFRDSGTWISDNIVTCYYRNYYNTGLSPFYHLLPLFNKIGNVGKNFKYIILRFNDDKVLITYKCIKIFKTSQIRIFNKPISLNGVVANEVYVVEYLNKLSCVKWAVSDPQLMPEDAELLYMYRDYYYDFTEDLRHKWLYRHKVIYFMSSPDYSVDVFCGNEHRYSTADLLELYDKWKRDSYYQITKSREQCFKNLMMSDNQNIYKSILYYKNKPICLDVGLVDKDIKTCLSFGIVHIGRDAWKEANKEHAKVLNNLMNIERYVLQEFLKPLGIYRVYIAGAEKHTTLDDHKQNTCDGYIDYYLCEELNYGFSR